MKLTNKYFSLCLLLTLTACQHSALTRNPTQAVNNPAVACQSATRQKITAFQIPENGLIKVAFFDADSTLQHKKLFAKEE